MPPFICGNVAIMDSMLIQGPPATYEAGRPIVNNSQAVRCWLGMFEADTKSRWYRYGKQPSCPYFMVRWYKILHGEHHGTMPAYQYARMSCEGHAAASPAFARSYCGLLFFLSDDIGISSSLSLYWSDSLTSLSGAPSGSCTQVTDFSRHSASMV